MNDAYITMQYIALINDDFINSRLVSCHMLHGLCVKVTFSFAAT